MPEIVLQRWEFVTTKAESLIVLPDGCRDVIFHWQADCNEVEMMVTDLDDCAYHVPVQVGEHFVGYRFHPAVCVDEQGLLALKHEMVKALLIQDEEAVLQGIGEHVQMDARLEEALQGIMFYQQPHQIAKGLGVSVRTLERLFGQTTGRTVLFWRALVRMRRAAKMMEQTNLPLAEIAAVQEYADQPHMTREFKRWLGISPGVFRAKEQWHCALLPGYD